MLVENPVSGYRTVFGFDANLDFREVTAQPGWRGDDKLPRLPTEQIPAGLDMLESGLARPVYGGDV